MKTIFTQVLRICVVFFLIAIPVQTTNPFHAQSAWAAHVEQEAVYELEISKSIFNRINSMGQSFLKSFFRSEEEFKLSQTDAKGELVAFCDQGDQILIKISRRSAQIWLSMMDDFSHSIFVDRDTQKVMAYMRDQFFATQTAQVQLVKG